MVVVGEGIVRPELFLQLFTGYKVTGSREQQREYAGGVPGELDTDTLVRQFLGMEIEFIGSESDMAIQGG
jgi:hypothetical protein